METMTIKNAVITSAGITCDGILSAWVMLDLGGCNQEFGGYALHLPESYTHYKKEGIAGHFIARVMAIAGVTEWDNLEGKAIRVKGTHWGIDSIGHIIKDDWFCPRVDFAEKE